MSNFIERLKHKSEEERRRIAFLSSAGIAGVVGVFFLVIFFGDVNRVNDANKNRPEQESMFSKFSNTYNSYKKDFEESPLAQQLESTTFVQRGSSTATSTASAGIIESLIAESLGLDIKGEKKEGAEGENGTSTGSTSPFSNSGTTTRPR